MKYTIDRFEGNFAVVELENGKFADIPRIAIPAEAREGDIIEVTVNKSETEKRRNEIREMEENLFID
ncbi:hypothetical protein CCDG5_0785 [[Clostridium] cellulosi]|jgi:Protein of unknown function (DUF3006).|uniref:DUF3006 domain-containing protein n=1 Tax=[Clostridium] cellulosi TaxID=29343 RepID=A0A078KS32_9FIRM|nr:hypothetical protein CCDG5_0785 [[Clostridium] cellulosi]